MKEQEMKKQPMLCLPINNESQLRLMELRYASAYYTLLENNRDTLRTWMSWVELMSSPDAMRGFMLSQMQHFIQGQGLPMTIWYQDELIGAISCIQSNHFATLGYWLDTSKQGKGFMTLAAQTLISYAFIEHRLGKIEIHCAVENERSCALAERLGFRREGLLRQREWLVDHFVDHVIYGMLASEWQE